MGGVKCLESAFGRPGNALEISHKLILKQCLSPRVSE